ncbi:DUF3991 and toprim domain-containing protein, partial [Hydrogenoanaerobacterium sp.]|uniref:DUF3991 and toprim domain-containing protein n=1 Tax=Hydrogenoanaerobacterium sp. TaxID=2953763 RepID=UPI002897B4D5
MGTYIHFTDEQKLCANNVDLVDFLERQGEKLIRSGPEKRLASDHSITVRGNEWYDHATESGGYAIDFVCQFYNLTFPEAVTMLLGGEQGKVYEPAEKKKQEQKKPFALPDANSDMRRVYGYLVKTRLLDREVVSYFAKQKLIYESCEKSKDGTKEYHNAVFVGLDENGVARHAHKRGLYTEGTGFKGNVDGCNPSYSFHHIGKSNLLYVFEAPIDMLSFISLHPKDWQNQSYVALCGVSEHAMLKALELHPNLNHVVLCLDHDEAGLEAEEKYYDLLSDKGVQCGRILPKFKDWNEVIKAAHGLPALPAEEHPQHRLRDEICGELSAVKPAEPLSANRLSAMLENVRTHLHGGRFSDAEDCLKEMLSGAVASAANEYRQMNHCRNLSTVQALLRYGFRTYENRGRFKTRLDTLDSAIMSLRGYERVLSSAEKEKLAESYEVVAAHCLKAVILMEQDQQKLEQKLAPAMAMA